MPDELSRFQTKGLPWSERASLGELNAVLSPNDYSLSNKFLHSIHLFGAQVALSLDPKPGVLLDFGCGTGRFIRFFAQHGYTVIGTEVTPEMLVEVQKFGLPDSARLYLTDGIHIPVPDQSIDMIWCCGVLRYSLFIPDPVYQDIAREMYRILKPGAYVVNLEMYVNTPPDIFTHDFEHVGFITKDIRVLQRYGARLERLIQWHRLPSIVVRIGAKLCATYRYWFDSATKQRGPTGLCDYLFIWNKPGLN